MAQPIVIAGASVLLPQGLTPDLAIVVEDGHVIGLTGTDRPAQVIDGRGKLLLPGIVDIHGDALERALEPRPGVAFPRALALMEHDGWCRDSGVTTTYLSLTDSFEPGLRSRATVRALLELLGETERPPLATSTLVHLRHEVCLTEGHGELLDWIQQRRIHLLSTADHLPLPGQTVKHQRYARAASRRLNGDEATTEALMARAAAERERGLQQQAELAVAARAVGMPLASHDDEGPEQAQASLERGISIGEFPSDVPTAHLLRQGGAGVLMGAPNLVRGGSHVGLMSVAQGVDAGVCDALCSDYHLPSVLQAPFLLASQGRCTFAEAWRMVSASPARLARLAERGAVAVGQRADLILVNPPQGVGGLARVVRRWVAGQEG